MTKRHYVFPDLQARPGDVLDHIDWIAQDIVRRRPDVLVVIGDWWDLSSLSSHEAPGSLSRENSRLEADIAAGMEAMERLMRPIQAEIARRKRRRISKWRPRLIFTTGNHEHRAKRVADADPRLIGIVGPHMCNVERFGFERYEFLQPVVVDGVHYAHYWQSAHSHRPIGGTADNRLNKICVTHVCGHEQGFRYAARPLATGRTIHSLTAGSCYLGVEGYRGPQARNEWRGVVVLNDVREGDFDIMPLTLRWLCEEYTGEKLFDYMTKRYPDRDWSHLA
jgi:hypothetical protein